MEVVVLLLAEEGVSVTPPKKKLPSFRMFTNLIKLVCLYGAEYVVVFQVGVNDIQFFGDCILKIFKRILGNVIHFINFA